MYTILKITYEKNYNIKAFLNIKLHVQYEIQNIRML